MGASPTQRRSNLPAELSSFVGRRRELASVRDGVATHRLVTLLGPGGIGKTRLALRAAADLERGLRDGAWVVELAPVHLPELVPCDSLLGFERLARLRIDLLLDQKIGRPNVAGSEIEHAVGRIAVAAGAPRFLVVAFECAGQVVRVGVVAADMEIMQAHESKDDKEQLADTVDAMLA